jgi:hypothetical protein
MLSSVVEQLLASAVLQRTSSASVASRYNYSEPAQQVPMTISSKHHGKAQFP